MLILSTQSSLFIAEVGGEGGGGPARITSCGTNGRGGGVRKDWGLEYKVQNSHLLYLEDKI